MNSKDRFERTHWSQASGSCLLLSLAVSRCLSLSFTGCIFYNKFSEVPTLGNFASSLSNERRLLVRIVIPLYYNDWSRHGANRTKSFQQINQFEARTDSSSGEAPEEP